MTFLLTNQSPDSLANYTSDALRVAQRPLQYLPDALQLAKARAMSAKGYFVDLFAGCGGLSMGLEQAGFHPVFVNELNKDALQSYLLNRETVEARLAQPEFHCNDVKDLVKGKRMANLIAEIRTEFGVNAKKKELDLVVGGPPCQGFSGIGHRRSYSVDKEQLPSNHLFQDMAWVVNQLRPKIFLFENVKGLLSAKWTPSGHKGEIWDDVRQAFESIGDYNINWSLVHAKDYGVPQNRPRVLLVGLRKDIDANPWLKDNSGIAKGFLPPKHGRPPDLAELFDDLLDPRYKNGGKTEAYPHEATNDYQRELRRTHDGKRVLGKGERVTEHEYSNHSPKIKEKFRYMLSHGGEIPEHLQTKKFAQRVLPAHWEEGVGPTITATSLPDDYVHYSRKQARTLTVREWARLQGFPDWYQFAGSRTTGGLRRAGNPREGVFDRELPKYTQIGNAVPVALARALGMHFLKVLK